MSKKWQTSTQWPKVRDFSAGSSQGENSNGSLGSEHPVWHGVKLGAQLSPRACRELLASEDPESFLPHGDTDKKVVLTSAVSNMTYVHCGSHTSIAQYLPAA